MPSSSNRGFLLKERHIDMRNRASAATGNRLCVKFEQISADGRPAELSPLEGNACSALVQEYFGVVIDTRRAEGSNGTYKSDMLLSQAPKCFFPMTLDEVKQFHVAFGCPDFIPHQLHYSVFQPLNRTADWLAAMAAFAYPYGFEVALGTSVAGWRRVLAPCPAGLTQEAAQTVLVAGLTVAGDLRTTRPDQQIPKPLWEDLLRLYLFVGRTRHAGWRHLRSQPGLFEMLEAHIRQTGRIFAGPDAGTGGSTMSPSTSLLRTELTTPQTCRPTADTVATTPCTEAGSRTYESLPYDDAYGQSILSHLGLLDGRD